MAKSKNLIWNKPIEIISLCIALSVTLVVIFVACTLAGMIFPAVPLAHGWLQLFSKAPLGSAQSWVDGFAGSIAFAWLTAIVLGLVYNRIVSR